MDELRLPAIHIHRDALLDFDAGLSHEWLVTNGLGGYASSTAFGVDTRRQHGLLFATPRPSSQQTLLLARVHDEISFDGDSFPLHAAEYSDGTVSPLGHLFLEKFSLDGQLPVWRYRCRDVEIEKTLWFERYHDTVFIRYRLLGRRRSIRLRLQPFVTHRGMGTHTHGDSNWQMAIEAFSHGCQIEAFPGATPLWLRLDGGRFAETGFWFWRFFHRHDRECALDDLEDLYTPGTFEQELLADHPITFIATTQLEDLVGDPDVSYQRERAREFQLLRQAGASATDPIRQRVVLATDQLAVRGAAGAAMVNGFPWYTRWVRDALIALPRLSLPTGREDSAYTAAAG